MDRAEEIQLLQQAKEGDADAFAALYQAHVQTIYRYVYHRVNDLHLAEDLTGDVFMHALQGLPKYNDHGKPFVAWLYSIAHARVVDYYRRVGRRPSESDIDAEPLAENPDLDRSMLRRQAAKELIKAIADLTVEQQQVIILRFIEGYHIEQVASIMGKNPNAVKALQHRALRSLATRLNRAGFDVESIISGLT